MNWKKCKVKPGSNIKLSEYRTNWHDKNADKVDLKYLLETETEEISKYQDKLYAENLQSLLIILQGMDSSGKDGTIKHIMSGVNPQGVNIFSFKHPTDLELKHDFLWRHSIKMPEHGEIVIFNRSYYENVIISKVHPEIVLAERLPDVRTIDKVNKKFWNKRYKQINQFEKSHVQNGTHILKIFLHLSKEEQRKRFLDRIENKEKHWKFSSDDIKERNHWDKYENSYEQTFIHTSTQVAPWYIIPADDKLFAHLLVGRIILEKLKKIDPAFPVVDKKEQAALSLAKKELGKKTK